ncbi:MAG: OST-HTH/LOTUS domain-containing protein, partial [Betaproteobacteria bacterium]
RRDPKAPQPIAKRPPEEMEARKSEAIELAVATFEALVIERGDSGKIWASMLKEAIKRRKPDFSESYYGFRSFGLLLEEAQKRGLIELGRDEKSGAFVFRSSTPSHVSAPALVEEKSEPAAPKRRGRGASPRATKEKPAVVPVVESIPEAATEKKPARSRRSRKPKAGPETMA